MLLTLVVFDGMSTIDTHIFAKSLKTFGRRDIPTMVTGVEIGTGYVIWFVAIDKRRLQCWHHQK